MKTLKITFILILTASLISVGYIYSLTFQPEGRLDWGQVLFLKMVGDNDEQIALLKKMNVQQRSHFIDALPFNTAGLTIDTLEITNDSLTVFIFKSQHLTKNSPVIVYFHGGAFVLPWTNLSVTYASRLANSFNAIVVGVDYRVAPEHPFPTPNNDCYATLLWTIQNIEKWEGNPNQIIIAGESAGATLATTVAIKAKEENLTNIKYQLLDCPVSYIPFKTDAYQKFKRGYYLEETEMLFGVESYLPNKADYTNPLAMPYYAVNLSNLPPAYVITTEFDPLRDTGRDYVRKLKEANVPTIHKEVKGMLHCIPGPLNEKDRTKLYNQIAKEINITT
ncbi:alpha/beta hydrolase [uncultured Pontibacter sp.]|uniref:alpha/beta hydrolase n=1 Tax=uncultured Pontibacter sp. TaxID=453356 RepID=UPI00261D5445|nr:alpha/beta hydrolase [uncultured Pontibacter sp.]